jgi:F-type H+-transporting ATPase subunit alpha
MGLSLFVADKGYLDDVSVSEVSAFEDALRNFMQSAHSPLMQKINDGGVYDAEIEKQLTVAVEEFKRTGSW